MSKKKKIEREEEEGEIHWMSWHGSCGSETWKKPMCVAKSEKFSREEMKTKIRASEYIDEPEVLDAKMKALAEMMKKSKCCVVYTGAGISRPVIADYATVAKNSVMNEYKVVKDPVFAQPTYSHHVLARLEAEGLIDYYIQQNHDGLPQKAGFPQEKMNEIHGGIFDPSNPIVPFDGNLRSDMYQGLRLYKKKADLVLCMGTSLSGMSSDRVVSKPCERYSEGEDGCLGSVVINLQFTPMDKPGFFPLRIWSKIDDAMKILIGHLGLEEKMEEKIPMTYVKGDRVICPYNEKGQFDESKRMVFDLSPGAKLVVVQPGAVNKGDRGECIKIDKTGHYLTAWTLTKRYLRHFGRWWLDTYQRGALPQIPIVNQQPRFLDEDEEL